MRAHVDKSACIGSGNCESTCPKVFKVIGGVSTVQVDPVPPEEERRVEAAVDACPVAAISTTEG